MTKPQFCGKVNKQKKNLRRDIMAKKVTKRKPLSGNRRSHACNATKHAFKTNLQTITINGKKVRMTAREIRTLNKMIAA